MEWQHKDIVKAELVIEGEYYKTYEAKVIFTMCQGALRKMKLAVNSTDFPEALILQEKKQDSEIFWMIVEAQNSRLFLKKETYFKLVKSNRPEDLS